MISEKQRIVYMLSSVFGLICPAVGGGVSFALFVGKSKIRPCPWLDGQSFSAFGSPPFDNISSLFCGHSFSEAMFTGSFYVAWLIRSFHNIKPLLLSFIFTVLTLSLLRPALLHGTVRLGVSKTLEKPKVKRKKRKTH